MTTQALALPNVMMAIGPVTPLPKRVRMSQDGVFIEEGIETPRRKLENVIILWAHVHRVLWGKQMGQFDCRSNDGKVPDPTVKEPKSDSCTTCPFAVWEKGGKGGTPAKCQQRAELYFASPTRGDAYVMTIPSTSVPSLQKMYLSVMMQIQDNPKLHPWNFQTTMTVAKAKYGCYKVIQFTDPQPTVKKLKKERTNLYKMVIAAAQDYVNQRKPQ